MGKVNRLPCTAKISPMMDEYYTGMKDLNCLCWCIGPSAYETMEAAGVSCFQCESSSARIAGGGAATPFIEYGQARGVSPDMCSYAKINIGLVLMQQDGKWDQIEERYHLPKPDIIVCGTICPSMMQWAHLLVQIYHVPLFVIDIPFSYDDSLEALREDALYVKEQYNNLLKFLIQHSGQKEYHMDQLIEQNACCREMDFYNRNIAELLKTVPAPASFIDNAVSMTPGISMRNQKAADFYKEFMEEMIDRVKKGIGSLENERYRIMWRGNFPWFKIGFLSRLLAKHDALLVTGEYGVYGTKERTANRLIPPDGYDRNDPLFSIAAANVGKIYAATYEHKWRCEFAQYIEEYSIDCVIIQAPHTCRPWTLTTRDLAKRVEQEYGIPAIVLEADHTDPAYFNDAQVETRIKALLETVDARRENQQ